MFSPDVRVQLFELDENLFFRRPAVVFVNDTDRTAVLEQPFESPLDVSVLKADLVLFVDLKWLVFNFFILSSSLCVDHLMKQKVKLLLVWHT